MSGERGDARSLGVERGRTDTHHEYREQYSRHSLAIGKHHYAESGGSHAGGQTVDKRTAVKRISHHRLEYRRGELIHKGYETYLAERQSQIGLEHGIHGCDHRLQQVVETMGRAQCEKHVESRHSGEIADFTCYVHERLMIGWCYDVERETEIPLRSGSVSGFRGTKISIISQMPPICSGNIFYHSKPKFCE